MDEIIKKPQAIIHFVGTLLFIGLAVYAILNYYDK